MRTMAKIKTATIDTIAEPATGSGTTREAAAQRVYAAECWLHTARQSDVDEWIAQAADLLHQAIEEYLRTSGRR